MKDYKMAKSKVNQNNVFADDDGDIEQDMKTLGQVRDVLLEDFKAAQNTSDKLALAAQIGLVVHAREEAELFLLRVMGYFDQNMEHDEDCPNHPHNHNHDHDDDHSDRN